MVEHCERYTYLGSPFTVDGSVSTALRTHVECKMPHVAKYISCLKKNDDIPFHVKRRCESWVSGNLKPVTKVYN